MGHGPIVDGLVHRPFKAEDRVRAPVGLRSSFAAKLQFWRCGETAHHESLIRTSFSVGTRHRYGEKMQALSSCDLARLVQAARREAPPSAEEPPFQEAVMTHRRNLHRLAATLLRQGRR